VLELHQLVHWLKQKAHQSRTDITPIVTVAFFTSAIPPEVSISFIQSVTITQLLQNKEYERSYRIFYYSITKSPIVDRSGEYRGDPMMGATI